MADLHATFDLLAAADRGQITRQELVDQLARHLVCLRPAWPTGRGARGDGRPRRTQDAVELSETAEFAPEDYDRVINATVRRARPTLEAVREDERRAKGELRRLLELAPVDALRTVEEARTRFRSAALAESLLRETRDALPDRPRRALALAELAEAVSRRLLAAGRPVPVFRAECLALSLAHQGNALRVLDALRAADDRFRRSREEADRGGVMDPAVLAELDGLEASLRRAQRRFDDSEALLRQGMALAVAADHRLLLVRILIKLGSLYHHWSRPEEALLCAGAALRAMPTEAPERLRLCAVHNRLFYLCELERFELAVPLLDEVRDLYARFGDPWTTNRLRWLEGKIAGGTGATDAAAALLEEAREGFAGIGAVYDSGLASLDLATLLLGASRTAAARRVAGEAVTLFAALEVPREATAALEQLRRALSREAERALTSAVLRRVSRTLEAVRPG